MIPSMFTWRFTLAMLFLAALAVGLTVWTGWSVLLLLPLLMPLIRALRHPRIRLLRKTLKHWGFYYPLLAIAALSIAVILRIFVLSVYGIPSSSMEGTILPGDQVLVSKLHYGPRMPEKPQDIPWYGILFSNSQKRWPEKRLTGTSTYQRHHVMVFERSGKPTPYIKRCVGLPGDTLRMTGWHLFINGKRLKPTPGIKHTFAVYYNARAKLSQWYKATSADWRGQDYINGKNYWLLGLTREQKQQLSNARFIDSLHPGQNQQDYSIIGETGQKHSQYPISTYRKKYYVEKANSSWHKDHFGPLIIPYKNMQIQLNANTVALYRQAIEQHEGDSIRMEPNGVQINGIPRETYTFAHNYYFMLGDNREASSDSRSWGFVPQNAIIGKAVLVMFNSHWKHLKKGRIFQRL